jgi:hypothetical protein
MRFRMNGRTTGTRRIRYFDPWTPMTPFNGSSDEMKAVGKYLREHDAVA